MQAKYFRFNLKKIQQSEIQTTDDVAIDKKIKITK